MSAVVEPAVVLVALGLSGERARMGRVVGLLPRLTRWTRHPAQHDHVRRVVFAVRRVGVVLPGRAHCLEESSAVVLALAVSRNLVM